MRAKSGRKSSPKSTTGRVSKPIKKLRGDSKYVIVKDGEVLGQAKGIVQAHKLKNAVRGGRTCMVIGARESKRVVEERRPNPLGEMLESLCGDVERDIAYTLDDAMGVSDCLDDTVNNGGKIFDHKDGFSSRPATNEECFAWEAELHLIGKFNRRKPLPAQVAKWLMEQSAMLAKAAGVIHRVDDQRAVGVIHKLSAEPKFVRSVVRRMKKFEPDGTLVDDPVARFRSERSKGGAV